MTTPTKTLAFFGATGDCAGHCLATTLKAGYHCTAMARTPSKLTAAMKAKGVSDAALDSQLTIIQGDARDPSAIKQTLFHNGKMADVIVSGMGGTPTLQWSIFRPVILTDRKVCQDFGDTLLKVATDLCKEQNITKKPLLANVSTTGIPSPGMPNDVPMLFVPFYHWLLADPHADKLVFQKQLESYVKLPQNEQGIRAYVHTKPSLLLDGDGQGVDKVKEGVENKPAVGYTIQRKDVGNWMFERFVKNECKSEWLNKSITITA